MNEGEILDGKYRLGPKLGEGSLGCVYEAQHTSLTRTAAVKVFRGELIEHAGGAERFLADARAAWKVRQRNIVDVHEFGRVDEHRVYVAMELVEGRTLQAYLEERGRLPWSRVQGIALQVCAALKAAHRRGVLHRGLKATNCFVFDEGTGEPAIKVSDFAVVRTGLAKLNPGADQTSVFFGDPSYAAPELNAKAEPSVRSDIYAVGVLLYRMLVGELPFSGDTPFQVLMAHAEGPVPPPRDKMPSIPEEVEGIIMRALAKEPSERFESIREIELAIEEALPEEDTEAEDAPDAGLEGLETEEHQQAQASEEEVPGRDEAMHGAFERRDEDDGGPEPTSMFAPQQLFPYYGAAAEDLGARPVPATPQGADVRPAPVPQLSSPPAPAFIPPGAARPSTPPLAPTFAPRGGDRPSTSPRASAFVPPGGDRPSATPLAPTSAPLGAERASTPIPESTVRFERGSLPPLSPEATMPFDRNAIELRTPERTARLDELTRQPEPEATVQMRPLGEASVGGLTERVSGLAEALEEIESTVHLPRGGVPVAITRRTGTKPAPQAAVVPAPSPVASSHLAQPISAPLPVRATSNSPATISAKHVIIGAVAAVVGTLVGLAIACPARGAAAHPIDRDGPLSVLHRCVEPGASNADDQ